MQITAIPSSEGEAEDETINNYQPKRISLMQSALALMPTAENFRLQKSVIPQNAIVLERGKVLIHLFVLVPD